MEIIQTNLHPKVLKNQLFINAVDWLIDNKKVGSQKELSAITGINEPTLSNIRNDKKVVSDKTIRKLLDAFPDIFNPGYFRGHNIYMTIEDAINAKVWEEDKKQEKLQQATTTIDSSSAFNAAIAAHVRIIDNLESQLAVKDKEMKERLADRDAVIAEKSAHIVTLERTIADKEEIIKARNARIVALERQLAEIRMQDINNYPFTIGAAEKSSTPNISPNKI